MSQLSSTTQFKLVDVRSSPLIAIVGRDPTAKLAAAAAFDEAPVEWRVTADESEAAVADVVVATPGVEWPSALRFDPRHPERLLVAIRDRLAMPGLGRLYVVASPLAGSGATTVALELATRFGEAGSSCLVDLDPMAGVSCRLGLAPPVPQVFSDTDPAATVPLGSGVRLLHGASIRGGTHTGAVARAEREFKTVVVDAGAANLDAELVSCARAVVVVMAATAIAASLARGMLGELRDRPLALIANRTGLGGEVARAELERLADHGITLELPFSTAVRDAERDGRCGVARWSAWSRRVARLCNALGQL